LRFDARLLRIPFGTAKSRLRLAATSASPGGAIRRAAMLATQRVSAERVDRPAWEAAYNGQAAAEVPDDLAAALAANPAAAGFFGGLDSRNRYAVLYRVQDAKRAETRSHRIEMFVDMLARRETIHP
jgi:uncharacterized protein YdeI (YjbR/CyaY-like superfamily)